MELYDLIREGNDFYVITELTNGVVTNKEELGLYLSKIRVINIDGEYTTIFALVEEMKKKFIERRFK